MKVSSVCAFSLSISIIIKSQRFTKVDTATVVYSIPFMCIHEHIDFSNFRGLIFYQNADI